jgi:hypothetical protein
VKIDGDSGGIMQSGVPAPEGAGFWRSVWSVAQWVLLWLLLIVLLEIALKMLGLYVFHDWASPVGLVLTVGIWWQRRRAVPPLPRTPSPSPPATEGALPEESSSLRS